MNKGILWSARAIVLLSICTAATPALAQPSGRFGDAGEFVISSDAQAQLRFESSSGSDTSTVIQLGPAADYFIVRGLSLGIGALYTHASYPPWPSTDSWNVGVRVGYNVFLSDVLSLWPRVSLGYVHASEVDLTTGSPSTFSTDGLTASAFVPLLLHPVRHFFLGLGPQVETTFAAWPSWASKPTDYGPCSCWVDGSARGDDVACTLAWSCDLPRGLLGLRRSTRGRSRPNGRRCRCPGGRDFERPPGCQRYW